MCDLLSLHCCCCWLRTWIWWCGFKVHSDRQTDGQRHSNETMVDGRQEWIRGRQPARRRLSVRRQPLCAARGSC
ncbi:hypothetical protein BC831DRAFT_490677, partial [Entophlyctis helioformis]